MGEYRKDCSDAFEVITSEGCSEHIYHPAIDAGMEGGVGQWLGLAEEGYCRGGLVETFWGFLLPVF